jgi:hypothetical protein
MEVIDEEPAEEVILSDNGRVSFLFPRSSCLKTRMFLGGGMLQSYDP